MSLFFFQIPSLKTVLFFCLQDTGNVSEMKIPVNYLLGPDPTQFLHHLNALDFLFFFYFIFFCRVVFCYCLFVFIDITFYHL